ncbi:MAG: PDZ domain-containing protein, partial [Ilumatobacter sp.]
MASLPRVVRVAADSPASSAGVLLGDEIVAVDGLAPRDLIEWRFATDAADPELTIRRGGLEVEARVAKAEGAPLGIEVDSAVFDRVRTCDNHCEFCFIHQLPKGMRR